MTTEVKTKTYPPTVKVEPALFCPFLRVMCRNDCIFHLGLPRCYLYIFMNELVWSLHKGEADGKNRT